MKRTFLILLAFVLSACGTGGVFSSSEATSAGVTDGATGVSAAGSYSVTFPKAVRTETVTEDTFYVASVPAASASIAKSAFNTTACAVANRVAGSTSCSSVYECSYTTTSSLQGNTQYALCLTNGIVYADGTTYVGSTDIFTTGPTVNSISPADGATGISTGTAVEVLFSSAVQASTVTASSFSVSSSGTAVAGSIALTSDRTVAVFTPASILQPAATYAVALTADILDDAGDALLPYTSSFATTLDTIPPLFSGITSASSDSTSAITLTWSAAYDDTSLASKIIYYIYMATTSGGEVYTSPSYTTSAGATSYEVTGLTQFTTYYFVVRAMDEAGNIDDNTVEESAVTLTTNMPTQLSRGSTGSHECTITEDGNLYCWGSNVSGQIGDGTTSNRYKPKLIGSDADWSSVAAGESHTCGTKTNGTLYCWGINSYGLLGDGSTTQRKSPTLVTGGYTDWSSVAAGSMHTCGTKTDGKLYCWGHNGYGQLGKGGDSDWGPHSTPILVAGTDDWSSVVTGSYHTCGKKTDGTLYCWGNNNYGQLGDGSTTQRTSPTQEASGLTDWSSVSAGLYHTCGEKTDGTLYCWGFNNVGQIGDGSATNRTSPTLVAGGYTDWSSVAAGSSHTCGTKTDGTLYCWGNNSYGQLGDGTTVTEYEPLHIGSNADWSSVAPGYFHTCGTKINRIPYCWGKNDSGQLGDETGITKYEPTRIGLDLGW